jgi:hypothetical protein
MDPGDTRQQLPQSVALKLDGSPQINKSAVIIARVGGLWFISADQ